MSKWFLILFFPFVAQSNVNLFFGKIKDDFFFDSKGKRFTLRPSKEHKNYLSSLKYPSILWGIKGKLDKQKLHIFEFPYFSSGFSTLQGTLVKNPDGTFSLKEKKNYVFKFSDAKMRYGNKFDEKSKNYFIGKKVFLNVQPNNLGPYSFDIFSVTLQSLSSVEIDEENLKFRKFFNRDPFSFVINEIPKNEYSKGTTSLKGTLFRSKKLQTGDSVLIISLSGRQGDHWTPVLGHFSIGRGRINKENQISGKMFNIYPPKNEKGVIPSSIDFLDYFGDLNYGQSVYRPTYNLFLYGIPFSKLKKLDSVIEKELHLLRTNKAPSMGIEYNCTTISLKALKKLNIFGGHLNFFKKLFSPHNIGKLNPFFYLADKKTRAGMLFHLMAENPAGYIPRLAFLSLLKNLNYLNEINNNFIKRADFIFYPQIPSNRPRGGVSIDELREQLAVNEIDGSKVQGVELAKAFDKIID